MSTKCMVWVLNNSSATGADKAVLISIANHAGDDGTHAWPSVATIARESGWSERTVQDALRRLAGKHITINLNGGPKGCNSYTVLMGGADAAPEEKQGERGADAAPGVQMPHPSLRVQMPQGGVQMPREGGADAAPEPSIEPSIEPLATGPLPAKAKPTTPASLEEFDRILRGVPAYKPTAEFYREVEERYQHLPLRLEATKMIGWLQGQGKRRGTTAFVLNWLERAAGRGAEPPMASRPVVTPQAPRPTYSLKR